MTLNAGTTNIPLTARITKAGNAGSFSGQTIIYMGYH
jgi:hypothetical protein